MPQKMVHEGPEGTRDLGVGGLKSDTWRGARRKARKMAEITNTKSTYASYGSDDSGFGKNGAAGGFFRTPSGQADRSRQQDKLNKQNFKNNIKD